VRWQPARIFATMQDSITLQYQVVTNGNIASAQLTSHSLSILTTLGAYDSSFHNLWSNPIMVHNDMVWNLPPPADHFLPISPPPHAPHFQFLLQCNSHPSPIQTAILSLAMTPSNVNVNLFLPNKACLNWQPQSQLGNCS
jgi:hypothetical protein